MTDKELRHLSRSELLQMMVAQGRELEELRTRLERTETALRRREIAMEHSGSIAEAALQLNGVFDAADAACQQYIENIRELSGRQKEICQRLEQENREKIETMLTQARQEQETLERETAERCQKLEQETAERCQKQEQETAERCQAMERQAQEAAQAAWDGLSAKLAAYCAQHQELTQLLSAAMSGHKSAADE